MLVEEVSSAASDVVSQQIFFGGAGFILFGQCMHVNTKFLCIKKFNMFVLFKRIVVSSPKN